MQTDNNMSADTNQRRALAHVRNYPDTVGFNDIISITDVIDIVNLPTLPTYRFTDTKGKDHE